MTKLYSAIRMRKEIRDASTVKGKLKWIFEHTDRIQEAGYEREEILLVLREVVRSLRELTILDLPKGPSAEGIVAKIAKAGAKLLIASAVDAGLSAAGAAVGQFIERGARGGVTSGSNRTPKVGAKKAGKRGAAKKAAKRGSGA